MVTLDRILVATDFGEASAAALEYGRSLATACGAALEVLHVTDLALKLTAGLDDYAGLAIEVQENFDRTVREQTEALLTNHDRQRLHAAAVVITSAEPGTAIVHHAQAHNMGLIVMGTHGRGGWSRLVMGSVAERVVRTAPCPVLTVHAMPARSATDQPAPARVEQVR